MEITVNETAPDNWNELILKSGYSHPYHLSFYAELFKNSMNVETKFVSFYENNNLQGLALFFEKKIQGIPFVKPEITQWLSYAPLIVFNENFSPIILKLKNFLKEKKIDYLNIWDSPLHSMKNLFLQNDFIGDKLENVVLFLKKDKDAQFSLLSRTARKCVNKASREGIEVEQSSSFEDLKDFYFHYKSHHEALGLNPYPFNYFESFISLMVKNNVGKMFVAKKDKEFASGVMVCLFNKQIYEFGKSLASEFRDSYPTDLVNWRIVEYGIENNYSHFDLSNVDPNAVEGSKEFNVKRFK